MESPKNTYTGSCFQSQKDQISEMCGTYAHIYIYIDMCLGGISSNTTVPAVILFSLVVRKTNT